MKLIKYLGIFLLFLVVAVGVLLMLAPKEIEYSTVTTINAPLEEVWEVLGDQDQLSNWLLGCTDVSITSGDSFAVGSTYDMTFEQDGKSMVLQETITKINAPTELSFDAGSEGMTINTNIVLSKESEDVTILTSNNTASSENYLMRASMMVPNLFKKNTANNYTSLKKLLEN